MKILIKSKILEIRYLVKSKCYIHLNDHDHEKSLNASCLFKICSAAVSLIICF